MANVTYTCVLPKTRIDMSTPAPGDYTGPEGPETPCCRSLLNLGLLQIGDTIRGNLCRGSLCFTLTTSIYILSSDGFCSEQIEFHLISI